MSIKIDREVLDGASLFQNLHFNFNDNNTVSDTCVLKDQDVLSVEEGEKYRHKFGKRISIMYQAGSNGVWGRYSGILLNAAKQPISGIQHNLSSHRGVENTLVYSSAFREFVI